MKRLPWKEFFLVVAPVGIVGLGVWGVQVREQIWPTKARVVECRVRPATPLEMSQGAELGVTVRALFPTFPKQCPGLRVSYTHPPEANRKQHQIKPRSVMYWRYSEVHSRAIELEENYAFPRSSFALPQQQLVVTPDLNNCEGRIPQKPVTLTARDISTPNFEVARRMNFRVTKALVEHPPSNLRTVSEQNIDIYFEDVRDELQGLHINPKCVGDWTWQDDKPQSLPANIGMWSGKGEQLSYVRVTLDTKGLVKIPPSPGTKISGQLSLNGGWPQEISIEWPQKLEPHRAFTPAKFSSKLIPMPVVLSVRGAVEPQ